MVKMGGPPRWTIAVFATWKSVRPFLNLPDRLGQRTRTEDILSSPIVPHRPPSSPAVFHCFPMLSAVFRRPPPSPAVLCSYLTPPGRSCLRSWGSSSLLMTAALGIQGPGRVKFCRPISSGGLGSPPTVPYGGPGRLRTPDYRRCCVQTLAYVSECDHQDGESQGGW